ncbi:MAG TPA: RNB domain-containing ribonuclease [Mycobacteriales bacterium]|nr:RNB domain-containing ribonuclease [Mycobacteriales bacterium]
MAHRPTVIHGADLSAHLAALRAELHVPGEFPPAVLADAASTWSRAHREDHTALPLRTLDPPGSRDLDQAFHIERSAAGWRVHYAIADVAAFVDPDGPVAAEAKVRGETIYLPDGRAPVYPPELSEGAASLLPDAERPAVLWILDLDSAGELRRVDVRRSIVRSRAQLDYLTLEETDPAVAADLRLIGELRQQRERARGGVSLNVPEQQVTYADGEWVVTYRSPQPSEGWNAQLSLLTGMAAASMMLDAKIGLLRVMPGPQRSTLGSLRRSAAALDVAWPSGTRYADVVRDLDPNVPTQAAMLRLASVLFRGARYVAFNGEQPLQRMHAAVAAPYAHATAPLRRLADRYVSEICVSVCAQRRGEDHPVPQWVQRDLPALPELMDHADQHAHQLDRAVVDLAETMLLADRVGEEFAGVIVEADDDHGEIQLRAPAVRARIDGTDLPLGHDVLATLTTADVATRRVRFTLDARPDPPASPEHVPSG